MPSRQWIVTGNVTRPVRLCGRSCELQLDTVKPTMEFQVRPDAAGRIVGSWNALDQNIDPWSMVIQYRSADA